MNKAQTYTMLNVALSKADSILPTRRQNHALKIFVLVLTAIALFYLGWEYGFTCGAIWQEARGGI